MACRVVLGGGTCCRRVGVLMALVTWSEDEETPMSVVLESGLLGRGNWVRGALLPT